MPTETHGAGAGLVTDSKDAAKDQSPPKPHINSLLTPETDWEWRDDDVTDSKGVAVWACLSFGAPPPYGDTEQVRAIRFESLHLC